MERPLFILNIYSNGEVSSQEILPSRNGINWVCLAYIGNRQYALSFDSLSFIPISQEKYNFLREHNNCIEIKHITCRTSNLYYEIPLNYPHPKVEIDNSRVEKKRIKPKHRSRGFVSLSDLNDLSNFVEVGEISESAISHILDNR